MTNNQLENATIESENLLKKLERLDKFSSKYSINPGKQTKELVTDLFSLSETLVNYDSPINQNQIIESELKRRLVGEAINLEQKLSGRLYDYETVLKLYSIPKDDIADLRTWLSANLANISESAERLFTSSDLDGYVLPLSHDIPGIKRQAEEFAGVHIQKYHKIIGKMLENLSNVGSFLRDIDAVATTQDRSYFDPRRNFLAIGIEAICYSDENSILHINEKELIRIYGHEGMGHALNFLLTRTNNLPYFLKIPSNLTTASAESVAQFYENLLIEDLKNSPKTQKELGIEHIFPKIYQETKDSEIIDQYNRKLMQYGISILADTSFGDPRDPKVIQEKAQKLYEVALDKTGIKSWINKHLSNYDSEGNLNYQLVGELRYCARPVERALEIFNQNGFSYNNPEDRSLIDATVLKGFWTPIGLVDNARLVAESRTK
ncbi:MAG: hypothetical protein WC867_05285 [Candidatus Pacearchaeota archaeon]|jgi:hypothetical protein